MSEDAPNLILARLGFFWRRGVASPSEIDSLRRLCEPLLDAEREAEEWERNNRERMKRLEAEAMWKDLVRRSSTDRIENATKLIIKDVLEAAREGKLVPEPKASQRGANASQTASVDVTSGGRASGPRPPTP